jgi:hypothetical protein
MHVDMWLRRVVVVLPILSTVMPSSFKQFIYLKKCMSLLIMCNILAAMVDYFLSVDNSKCPVCLVNDKKVKTIWSFEKDCVGYIETVQICVGNATICNIVMHMSDHRWSLDW